MPDTSAASPTASDAAHDLAQSLRAQIRGDVRFDNGTRALYATDGSNYRQVPIGVVLPRDNDDVLAAISICREFGAPLLCRGAGTSLAGQCCNVAVILDFSRYMNQILEIDPARRIARVQPGVVLDQLRNAAEKHHLTFAPDPATHDRCTIGGMIGNNSCGVHSVMAGKTDDNIDKLDVVTYDGLRLRVGREPSPASGAEVRVGTGTPTGPGGAGVTRSNDRVTQILTSLRQLASDYADLIRTKFPQIPRRVSGYNLNYLLPEKGFHLARALVGTEGTCATILEATCKLVESPPQRVLLVVAYPDIYQCADAVPAIMQHRPIGLEGFDDLLVGYTRQKKLNPEGLSLLPAGNGWLLVEFGGETLAEAEAQALGLIQALNRTANPPHTSLYSGAQAKRVWEVRETSLGATSHVPGEPMSWEGWEDAAVAPEKLGSYLRDLRKMMAAFNYRGSLYGHFGHGCVHTRINFDLKSTEGIAKFRRFVEEAADLVVSYGGSLSGEHGDGQSRAELLPKMFGPELIEAFRKFKTAWDPDWKMNPGKVIGFPGKLPNKLDDNLRLGANYAPWEPKTHFAFLDDHGSLAEATLRCVGVGKCRREESGVMCPSWRATHEEEHSTRGRAHLLWEMTQASRDDGIIRDGWHSEEVKQSLDLCLACKGCKSDCPVGVDVATYKAEFFSHYYEGRLRPISAYAFGNIDLWARLASNAPGLVNLTTQLPFLRDLAKLLAGIPHQRSIPAFAPETFKSWFVRRAMNGFERARLSAAPKGGQKEDGALAQNRPPVLLWPDTFNNYFIPQTARAAVEVLETAGYRVLVPRAHLCCGRPLYDFGMLDRAQRLFLEILDTLEPEIEAGIPIVGLEPSCVAVFRDELLNLFPHDQRARKLSRQTFLLSEFLTRELDRNPTAVPLPQLNRKALLHGHCHHKSIMKMTAEESLLRRLGVDFTTPAPGCCGMAGSFGFERDKYEISAAVGELELLPAVRRAPSDWLIIADGFSCREQIAQMTERRALHLAEVLQMALDPSLQASEPYPESRSLRTRETAIQASMTRSALSLGALAFAGLLFWRLSPK
ncbi:MAG TPA: FAD-linked oxidase C-terminal domain-containing protein [Verrucomicrobiae bacterium]|jgi:FAD/FMN-containing dehydrogenase/Fe-S oxidoreductase|nr:FAD-linked oxidase C-terminal domain-containing protein [Verrucomicrobiae bacterium]